MERVLHILARTPVGGVGSFLMNTENTISNNFKFDYLILEDVANSQFIPSVKNNGGRVYLIDEKLSLMNYVKIKNKIKELLKKTNYRIVHLHSANIAMIVLPLCKKYNIPIRILHSHSTKYSDNFIKSIRNYIIELPMFNYTTHLLACSETSGQFLFKNRNYEVIYNGIDTNKFNYNPKSKKNDKLIIGHVGNFVPVKNHDYLIQIFNELCKSDNRYELWLFGDGPTRKNIEMKVKKLRLDNKVKFFGRVPDMQKYYNEMDLFLLPSLYEGFPVAAMEAQAHGLPVIASKNVTKEINFYGDDIFLSIKDNDIKFWVNAIKNIKISNKKKKAIAFKNSKFNIKNTTQNLEQFYNNCINQLK